MKLHDLVVDGVGYGNSAAKFWRGLLEYLYKDYENFSCAELSAPAVSSLKQSMLFPQLELEEDIHRFAGQDLQASLKETIAELEMLGPPPRVEVRIMDDAGQDLATYALPVEHVDAETFQYLAAWMLAWSHIPVSQWNAEHMQGAIAAVTDPSLAKAYAIDVTLRHREIHEGLLQRTLTLAPLAINADS